MTSKLVRPGQIYKLSVRLYHARHPIHVRASIQRNGVELSSNMQHVKENIPETLIMRVCNPLWSYLFRFLDSIIVKDLMQNTKKKKKYSFEQRDITTHSISKQPDLTFLGYKLLLLWSQLFSIHTSCLSSQFKKFNISHLLFFSLSTVGQDSRPHSYNRNPSWKVVENELFICILILQVNSTIIFYKSPFLFLSDPSNQCSRRLQAESRRSLWWSDGRCCISQRDPVDVFPEVHDDFHSNWQTNL